MVGNSTATPLDHPARAAQAASAKLLDLAKQITLGRYFADVKRLWFTYVHDLNRESICVEYALEINKGDLLLRTLELSSEKFAR
ncbi:hypothetical protein FRC16_000159 [Serendipita sp. 398]|nr:hypothetical protein FRC16_000159 [Serendipita sp. 398]